MPNDSIRWGRIIAVASAGIVSHSFGRATLPLLLPAISDELGISSTTAGIVGSTNMASYFLGVIIVTYLAGRMHPIRLLRLGMGIVIAGLVILGTTSSQTQLIAGTALTGLGGAGIWLTAPLIATTNVPVHRRGAAMGTLTACMGIASITIPIITTVTRNVISDQGAWRPVWIIEVFIAVILFVAIAAVVRVDGVQNKLSSSTGIYAVKNLRKWRTAVIFYMSFAFIAATYYQFFGLALEKDHGFSRSFTTLTASILGIGSVIGALTFGRLSDRLGRPVTMSITMLLTSLSCIAIPIGSERITVIAIALYGAASFSIPALVATFVRDQVSDQQFTAVFGAMTIFYGPASILGPLAGGYLGDKTGNYSSTYLLLGAICCAAAVIVCWLPKLSFEQHEISLRNSPQNKVLNLLNELEESFSKFNKRKT